MFVRRHAETRLRLWDKPVIAHRGKVTGTCSSVIWPWRAFGCSKAQLFWIDDLIWWVVCFNILPGELGVEKARHGHDRYQLGNNKAVKVNSRHCSHFRISWVNWLGPFMAAKGTCVVVGDAAVGKTSVLIRYKDGTLPNDDEYALCLLFCPLFSFAFVLFFVLFFVFCFLFV